MSHLDSPGRAPRVGAFAAPCQSLCLPEPSQFKVFPELANSQQPIEHRLLLFLLTERGLNEDFLTAVCEHCAILGWFAPDVQDRPK
jgi:hypothetical protein